VPANRRRGEVEITLEGETRLLRPTFEAIVAIDDLTRVPFHFLAARANADPCELRLLDVTAMIFCGLAATEGDNRAPTFREVGELVLAAGYTSFLDDLVGFIAYGIGGAGDDTEGDPPKKQ
jgi:hypothetical protein